MAHKLLLADDSVTIQRVIELTFADEDVQVIAVGDGRQAIERVERDRPDIVLADVGMPERDGYEVAAFIKGKPELAHIPVLLLTGAFEPIDEGRAKAVGCDGVLVKPFEPQMVISRVKDLLSGRKPVSLWANTPAPAQARQAVPAVGMHDLKSPSDAPPPAPAGSLEDYFDRLDAAFATLDGGQPDAASRPPAAAAPTASMSAPSPAPPVDVDAPRQPAPASPFGAGDDLAGWDPDLTGDPARPAPVTPPPAAPPPVAPPPVAAAPIASAPPVAATPPPAAHVPPPPAPSAPAVTTAPAPAAAPAPPSAPSSMAPFAAPSGPMPSLAEAFAALLAAEQGQHFSVAITPSQAVPDDVIEDIVRRVIARMTDQAVRETVGDVAERLVREEIARIKGVNP